MNDTFDAPAAGPNEGEQAAWRADLAVDRATIAGLAKTHGTPLFLYSAGRMRAARDRLAAALGGFAEILYSVKANPNPSVVRVLAEAGCGAEIASGAEYLFARAADVPPERVVFAGPGKGEAELRLVLARGIGEVHVESREEIALLSRLAAEAGRTVAVSIRVNPQPEVQGGAMRMGGRSSPFGFDEPDMAEVAAIIAATPGLDLKGIHLFAGTQILDAALLAGQWAHGLELAERLGEATGRPLETIDLGGGLGVPYFAGESALDLAQVSKAAAALAARRKASRWLASATIYIEPGRYLVADSGVYVAQVIAAKQSYGARYLVTDGGMHHHLAAAGLLGQVLKRDFPVAAVTWRAEAPVVPHVVTGPLCTPLDTLARRAALPPLAAGDLLALPMSGAYALSASPTGFLSHPMPAEILLDAGTARLIRPRGTFEAPVTAPSDLI